MFNLVTIAADMTPARVVSAVGNTASVPSELNTVTDEAVNEYDRLVVTFDTLAVLAVTAAAWAADITPANEEVAAGRTASVPSELSTVNVVAV